jgi:hypothetical protein
MAALYACHLQFCPKAVPEAEASGAGWVFVTDRDGGGVYCTRTHAAQALGGKGYADGYKKATVDVTMAVANELTNMGGLISYEVRG